MAPKVHTVRLGYKSISNCTVALSKVNKDSDVFCLALGRATLPVGGRGFQYVNDSIYDSLSLRSFVPLMFISCYLICDIDYILARCGF